MYRFWVEYTDLGHLEKTEKRPEDFGKKVLPDGTEEEDTRGFMIEIDESIIAAIAEPEPDGNGFMYVQVDVEREIYKTAMAMAYDRCQEISHYYAPTSIELISC